MTVARELRLLKDDSGYRLIVVPVRELQGYRSKKFKEENVQISGSKRIIGSDNIDLSKAEINFEISELRPIVYTFTLTNELGDELVFAYDHRNQQFFINRGKAGITSFSPDFGNKKTVAPKAYQEDSLKGTIILDKTSIELFFDDGKTVMTEIVFPKSPFTTLLLESENQEITLDFIEAHELKFN
jgi:levanase/fructan beta-fructosidase